ncbi:MAG: ABC transporter permease [Candidatus Omnitrophica bacterium]|nr:ABC transporter permease [Candidatus Omnitrophota bacterium]
MMRYELFLALRYLGGLRRQQPFVSVIAAISVLGVALGVAALLVVLGVMAGFDADLEGKIIGANPHLIVEMDGGVIDEDSVLRSVEQIPGVVAAAGFVQTQVLLKYKDQATGVILRGVDPVKEPRVTGLARSMGEGIWPPGPEEVILGSELMRRWRLREGDSVIVMGGEKGSRHPMVVKGEFSTGMYDYDLNLALASQETVRGILDWPSGKISGVGVRIREAIQAPALKRTLQRRLGFPYWVMSWMDLNRNLFAALKLEKVTMFLILTLIVLVACFNIIATILMMVVAKTKEVGILKSIGATSASVRRIFTWAGLLIGAGGTGLGTAVGLGLCGLLKKYPFVRLPAEIYYIDRLPVRLEFGDVLAVVLAAIAISWAACLYPAWVAARLSPAEAVRYE